MRTFASFLVIAFAGALLVAGCAKKELVKKEEPAPTTATAPQPAEPAPTAPPAREQVVQPQPVEESKVPEGKEEAAAQAAKGASLQTVYFDYDAFTLSDQARDALAQNADILKKRKGARVQLEGHTDERGSDEYNLALGEKRAAAAKKYLTAMGVPGDSLSIITYGEEKPAAQGSSEEAWAKNRRVEFVVSK